MRTSRRTVAVAVAILSVLAIAAPAEAHTALTSSDPAKGSTVAPPRQIRLTFTEPVRFTGVIVEDTTGGHHESGRSQAVGNHVTEAIAGVLAPGVYTVGWRVVAADGHPVTGAYKFTVKGGSGTSLSSPSSAAASSAASSPATTGAPATRQDARSGGRGSSAGWWWIGLVVLVLALAAGGVAVIRRRG